MMKKIICAVLAFALVFGILPITAFAAEKYALEVVVDEAPLRKKASAEGEIIVRCEKGTVLTCVGSLINKKLNKWFKVDVNGDTYYMFSGNVEPHKHSYTDIEIGDVIYHICNCGDISADANSQKALKDSDTVLSTVALAIPLAAGDGPLPIGDFLAAGVVLVGACLAHDIAVPTADQLAEMITEADFVDYLKNRDENKCSAESFRRVVRGVGELRYIDKECLDAVEAYICVLLGMDVYTASEDQALLLASFHGSAIMERDRPSPQKDVSTYFYHFHLGNREIAAHIFFGLNDLGEGPKEPDEA